MDDQTMTDRQYRQRGMGGDISIDRQADSQIDRWTKRNRHVEK